MRKKIPREFGLMILISLLIFIFIVIGYSENAKAGSYDGKDLALAILVNESTLVSSSYTDADASGHRQGIVLSSLGTMLPRHGSNFTLLSSGVAGYVPVTTDEENPGDERGSWFAGGKKGYPRDEATLTLILDVPPFMHYLYYDIQFFSAEAPEYIGTQYNDKITVTVDSPSQGVTTYVIDVNSGDFVLWSNDIPGSGFNIFAQSGYPGGVDIVDTTLRIPGADAGATALVTREHPVSPYEQITVTFNMKDSGDNLFDSAAFIDNLMFSGYAIPNITARKTVQDLNGEPTEAGDNIRYIVTITNIGDADQGNNPGNEFEDIIPYNTTYLGDSITATSGIINYIEEENKIIWNGGVPAMSSVALTFDVTVNTSVINGTIISNQGVVYWDSNENGINDATELTDDPTTTELDHDPTNITVISFEPPSTVTEYFSDDSAGGKATQSYFGRNWFETNEGSLGSIFEVVSSYHYSTSKAFKTKIRSSGGTLYWNYSLSELDSDMIWWEVWFACGNSSEPSNLQLDFKNIYGSTIAIIKFEYIQAGIQSPTDWVLELYYWDPTTGWNRLYSDYTGGYLFNGWYKLRLERNGESFIDYSLNKSGIGMVDFKIGNQLGSPFENLARVEWTNSRNPIVCPMFFWDEHKLGLTTT